MTVMWSIVLLISTVLAIAAVYFFGHALIAHDTIWFAASAVCLLASAALVFVQVKFRPDGRDSHHAPH